MNETESTSSTQQDATRNDAHTEAHTEASNKFESGKSHVKQAANDIRSAAEAKAHEIRERAEDAYGHARERARSWQEDGETYVRNNPLRGVMTALGIGFILGLLIRR